MRRDPQVVALWVIAAILLLMWLFGLDVVSFND